VSQRVLFSLHCCLTNEYGSNFDPCMYTAINLVMAMFPF
jgi:hypothetical protein